MGVKRCQPAACAPPLTILLAALQQQHLYHFWVPSGLEDTYRPALLGVALGTAFCVLGRYALARLWRRPSQPLRVVVTGGTRGLGKALAREHLAAGACTVALISGGWTTLGQGPERGALRDCARPVAFL